MKNTYRNVAMGVLLSVLFVVPSVGADTPWNAPQRQVYRAALNGADSLAQLLATGVQIDARDDDQETALMEAADEGKLSALANLIAAGANVNLRNEDGETALMMAADEGYNGIVEALISAGADVNAVDEDGETALYKARSERHAETVEILLRAGAR